MKNQSLSFQGLIFLFFLLLGGIQSVGAIENVQLDCEYSAKFQQCMLANQNGTTRGIDEFACLQSTDPSRILDQIILDVKFKEIQEKQIKFIIQLKKDKEAVVLDQNRLIDDITKNFGKQGVYYKEYQKLCNGGILAERMNCSEKIANTEAGLRIRGSGLTQSCMTLANTHLDIYKQIAYDTLKLNKSEVHEGNKKKYVQQERSKYDTLLNIMFDIVGYMGRFARGMTHWTPNPLR